MYAKYRFVKGHLLGFKRQPFTRQKTAYYNAIHHLLLFSRFPLISIHIIYIKKPYVKTTDNTFSPHPAPIPRNHPNGAYTTGIKVL